MSSAVPHLHLHLKAEVHFHKRYLGVRGVAHFDYDFVVGNAQSPRYVIAACPIASRKHACLSSDSSGSIHLRRSPVIALNPLKDEIEKTLTGQLNPPGTWRGLVRFVYSQLKSQPRHIVRFIVIQDKC